MYFYEIQELRDVLNKLSYHFPNTTLFKTLNAKIETEWKAIKESRNGILPPALPAEWKDWCKDESKTVFMGERIVGPIYYPNQVRLSPGSIVDKTVMTNKSIEAQQNTIIQGDIISKDRIVWKGQEVCSLIAPVIRLDKSRSSSQKINGSIICHSLEFSDSDNYIPENIEIEKFLIVTGKKLNSMSSKDTILKIGKKSKIGGIYSPSSLSTQDDVTIKHLQVAGNIVLGKRNKINILKGSDITVGSDCIVRDSIYAEGRLHVESGSDIYTAIAKDNIFLEKDVHIRGLYVASLQGKIEASQNNVSNKKFHYHADVDAFLSCKDKELSEINRNGFMIIPRLNHTLYSFLYSISGNWCPELEPVND